MSGRCFYYEIILNSLIYVTVVFVSNLKSTWKINDQWEIPEYFPSRSRTMPPSIKLASIPVVYKDYLKNLGESKGAHVINIEREIHRCFSQFLHLHDGV